MIDRYDLVVCLGVVTMVAGLSLWSIAAGLVVAGAFVVTVGLLLSARAKHPPRREG